MARQTHFQSIDSLLALLAEVLQATAIPLLHHPPSRLVAIRRPLARPRCYRCSFLTNQDLNILYPRQNIRRLTSIESSRPSEGLISTSVRASQVRDHLKSPTRPGTERPTRKRGVELRTTRPISARGPRTLRVSTLLPPDRRSLRHLTHRLATIERNLNIPQLPTMEEKLTREITLVPLVPRVNNLTGERLSRNILITPKTTYQSIIPMLATLRLRILMASRLEDP